MGYNLEFIMGTESMLLIIMIMIIEDSRLLN